MQQVTVKLDHVTASGRREGWWMHVHSVAPQSRKAGFSGFKGVRLAHGSCELPPHAVLLLVRPRGTAKADERRADVYQVGGDGLLHGMAYGFDWTPGNSYEALKSEVTGALGAQRAITRLGNEILNTAKDLVGHQVSPGLRQTLCGRLGGIVARYMPPASAVDVTGVQGDPHSVLITVRVPTYEEVSRD